MATTSRNYDCPTGHCAGFDPDTLAADRCHACDVVLCEHNRAGVMPETCDDCESECLCWVCRDTHHMFAEDRAEQAAFDHMREVS